MALLMMHIIILSIREKDKLDLELMSYTDIAYEIIKEDLYIYQCNYFGFDDITLDEIYFQFE